VAGVKFKGGMDAAPEFDAAPVFDEVGLLVKTCVVVVSTSMVISVELLFCTGDGAATESKRRNKIKLGI
jgi:hypothetical protein